MNQYKFDQLNRIMLEWVLAITFLVGFLAVLWVNLPSKPVQSLTPVMVVIDTVKVETFNYMARPTRTSRELRTVTDTIIKLDNDQIITRYSGYNLEPFSTYKTKRFYQIKDNQLIEL